MSICKGRLASSPERLGVSTWWVLVSQGSGEAQHEENTQGRHSYQQKEGLGVMHQAIWISADGPDGNGPVGPDIHLWCHCECHLAILTSSYTIPKAPWLLPFSKLLSGFPPKGINAFSASLRLDSRICMDRGDQARGQQTETEPTWQAGTLVGGVPRRAAGASVLAG